MSFVPNWKPVVYIIGEEEPRQVRAVKTFGGHEIVVSSRVFPVDERTDAADAALQHMVAALPHLMEATRSSLDLHVKARDSIRSICSTHQDSRDLADTLEVANQRIAELEMVLARAAGRLS